MAGGGIEDRPNEHESVMMLVPSILLPPRTGL
jgi:hypothetical protein